MTPNEAPRFVSEALQMSPVESRFLPQGETLVGFGFRCWLGGYQTGNLECWHRCRDHFSCELGGAACAAISDLANWVNTIRCRGLRPTELLSECCRSFCRDECLAVTLVAASEHRHCPALQICAYTLLGADDIEPALTAAHDFNRTLRLCGISFEADPLRPDRPITRYVRPN
jgi:hypothetical protein